MENVVETSASVLKKEKVAIRPIRRPSDWLPSGHDSEFMNEGSKWVLCVPSFEDRKVLVDPLKGMSSEHKAELAELLGLENASRFNVHREDTYWKGFEIQLDRVGKVLDLTDPHDLITLKVLECNTNWIAPNWSMRNMKQTYKYALEFESDKVNSEIAEVNIKEKSYVALSKMGNSRDIMGDFLWSYYLQVKTAQRPPIDAPTDWLKKEVGKIIDNDPNMFLKIIEDEDYPIKVLIMKALNTGALSRAGEQFRFPGGEFNVGSLQQMVDHLKDDRYQDDFIKLKTQINVAETTVLDQKIREVKTPEPKPEAQVPAPTVPEPAATPEPTAPIESVVDPEPTQEPVKEKSKEELAADILKLKGEFDDQPAPSDAEVPPLPGNIDEITEENRGTGDEKENPNLDDKPQVE